MAENKRRKLTSEQEQVLRRYKEDNNLEFRYSKDRRYRIEDDLYTNLFSNMPEIPDGHKISGKSTLYDQDGNKILQWVKTSEDREQRELIIQSIIDGLNSKIEKAKPSEFSAADLLNSDIINQYTITDFHLGMMAWHEESGDDWDLKIGEDMLISWFKQAIETSPKAESCIFAQIGDFLHFDSLEAITPTSRHTLDSDTRFTKLVRTSIRVLRRITEMLLSKYKNIHIIFAEGNHDLASSVWLRESFSFYYEDEPRVTIDTSADPYYLYMFGSTFLGYSHGHLKKFGLLDTVFASKFKEQFGMSKNAYIHSGHLHHAEVKETNLMIMEQHRTLAAKDSYASRGGWLSGRDAKVISYHKEYGEVARLTINSDILKRK